MHYRRPQVNGHGFRSMALACVLLAGVGAVPSWSLDRWEWVWHSPAVEVLGQCGMWQRADDSKAPWGQGQIGPICALSDGSVLVGVDSGVAGDGWHGSLWRFSGDTVRLLWPFSGPGAPVPTCVVESPPGRLWVGTTEGIWIWHSDTWLGLRGYRAHEQIGTQAWPAVPHVFGAVTSIAAENESQVWVCNDQGFLISIRCPVADRPDRWMTEHSAVLRRGEPLDMKAVSFVLVASGSDGSVWALKKEGHLCRKNHGEAWSVTRAELPLQEGERITAFYIDRASTPWLATAGKRGGRVFRCEGAKWTLDDSLTRALPPYYVVAFVEDAHEGFVAVTTGKGLIARDAIEWGPHPANELCPHILPRQRSREDKAMLEKALRIDDVQMTLREQIQPAACWTSDGCLWVAGRGQLSRLAPGSR